MTRPQLGGPDFDPRGGTDFDPRGGTDFTPYRRGDQRLRTRTSPPSRPPDPVNLVYKDRERKGLRVTAAVAQRAPTIIVSAGRKGGSGKTTTALNLAGALAETGIRILLIDLDPQASLTRLLLAEEAAGLHGIGDRMMAPALGVVDDGPSGGAQVVPSIQQ